MGGYFTVDNAFWSDPDILDNYTPEDKYFYLYLLTCPNANISGCYEISLKKMSYDTGYSTDTVSRLLERFINIHRVIDYDRETKELLVCRWAKYHWTKSPKYIVALKKKITDIKSLKFKKFLTLNCKNLEDSEEKETVWIPYQYGMDTSFTSSLSLTSSEPFIGEKEIGVQGEEEKQEPKKEAKKSTKKEKKIGVFGEFAGNNAELLDALNEYEKMRNEKRKPMTDRSRTLLVNRLRDKFPPHQWIAIVDQSTLNGWDSVYPLKDESNWGGRNNKRGNEDGNVFFQNAREMVTNEYIGN